MAQPKSNLASDEQGNGLDTATQITRKILERDTNNEFAGWEDEDTGEIQASPAPLKEAHELKRSASQPVSAHPAAGSLASDEAGDLPAEVEEEFPEDYPDYYPDGNAAPELIVEEINIRRRREDTRGLLAVIYTMATFAIFILGFVVAILDAAWRQTSIIENLTTILPLISGIFLGSLGFVLGYYFRKIETEE